MITFLSGGTGTPKLIEGFRKNLVDNQISVIANSADDIWIYGLYVSPDVDTVTYLFGNVLDTDKFWGIKADTYYILQYLSKLGVETWFQIGDKDLATHLFRTDLIKKGQNLSQITERLSINLQIDSKIFPSSDTHIETRIITSDGQDIHFQEFWVKKRAEIEIEDIYVKNLNEAKIPQNVLRSIDECQKIVIGPSNPITSIGPIINLSPIRKALKKGKEKAIAISPIIGENPISGPTAKLMKAKGYDISPLEIAKMYEEICDIFIIHLTDKELKGVIEKETGLTVLIENILFADINVASNLAKKILNRGRIK